jgi:hypothetical protein
MAASPPRLRSALLYAMGILSASTHADRAQYGASPIERAAPALARRSSAAQRVGGYARLPLRFSTL